MLWFVILFLQVSLHYSYFIVHLSSFIIIYILCPQVRVEQGMEPACFLSLFDGHMITHLGKRDDDEKKNSSKLYIVQHEHESEASLLEVPCTTESLRRLAHITAL